MRLAQATAMDRVRPRGGTEFAALKSVDGGIDMRLARNEFESVQLVETPEKGRSLTGVRVTAGDLFTKRRFWIGPRHRFAATSVTCGVLGYVRTREPPQIWFYENGKRVKPEPGWWPDPVMDFTDRADVADGDLQGFWIRMKCPEGQPAGEYLGAPSAPWSRRAEELLAVPQDVMVSMTNYTHSAAAVYRWRDAMADLIEGKTER